MAYVRLRSDPETRDRDLLRAERRVLGTEASICKRQEKHLRQTVDVYAHRDTLTRVNSAKVSRKHLLNSLQTALCVVKLHTLIGTDVFFTE